VDSVFSSYGHAFRNASELSASIIPVGLVRTNSCQDVPITNGVHPVVVFTHGYTGTFTDYTFLMEDLASRGYVVAAVDHTYEATAVEFPDGRLATSRLGSHLSGTTRTDESALSFASYVRLADLSFVVDQLTTLNAGSGSPFAQKLDTSRVALVGHSVGSWAVLLGIQHDPRFKAGILIDSNPPEALVRPTAVPIFFLAAGREQWSATGREQWSDTECRLWSDLGGPRLAVNLRGPST
jgi:dienelactone hydrolase